MPITSPNNELLKEVRKLAGRKWRDKLREFVAEGEDLIAAAAAAGWQPGRCCSARPGPGSRARRSRRTCSQQYSQLGSGTRAIGRLRAALGAARRPARSASRCGASATRATSARCCAAALAFGAGSVALGPGTADPYGHKAVRASMGAIFSVPVVRVRDVDELPGRTVALVARSGEPAERARGGDADARGRRRARGAAGGRRRRVRRDGAHPDRARSP